MKLNLLAEARRLGVPDLTIGTPGHAKTGAQWNASKPEGVPAIPSMLAKNMIEDVQWDAPGRAPYADEESGQQPGDPRIGIQMGGVRKTKGGYAFNGWWYVLKLVHRKGHVNKSHGQTQGIQERDIYYWYRRKRGPSLTPGRDGKVIEQYVGKILKDKDTQQRIIIPEGLKDEIDREVERIQHAESREKRARERAKNPNSALPFPGGMAAVADSPVPPSM